MNSLNLHRTGKLLRWSFVNDWPYIRKTMATDFTIPVVFFQVNNVAYLWGSEDHSSDMPEIAAVAFLLMTLLMGASYMFMSFHDNRDAQRNLFLLPANNIEKFLVRYLYGWMVQLVLIIAGILLADVLQYIVGLVIQRDGLHFVTAHVIDALSLSSHNSPELSGFCIVMLMVWIHSFYMLGANFFRQVKYSWGYTSLVLLMLLILCLVFVSPHVLKNAFTVGTGFVLLALSILNVWLSYQLFCRWQLKRKFVNWF